METADSIRKIVDARNLSQAELAELLGVDRSQANRYITGEREPGALPCLLLSALAEGKTECDFWVAKSGLNHKQIVLLGKLLAVQQPDMLTGDERELLDWWRNPENEIDLSVKSTVELLLSGRRSK